MNLFEHAQINIQTEIENLRAEINRHNELYYQNSAPEISDAEFDALLERLKVSRSKIFAMGVKKLGEEYDGEDITARINAVCEEVDTSLDPFWKKKQSRILSKEKW